MVIDESTIRATETLLTDEMSVRKIGSATRGRFSDIRFIGQQRGMIARIVELVTSTGRMALGHAQELVPKLVPPYYVQP